MNKTEIYELKKDYNHNLNRLINGFKYIQEHKDEEDKWMPEIFKIWGRMCDIYEQIKQYEPTNGEQVEKGFEI